ncbi:putative lysine-specific demethylase JMJ16 isoform X2 [Physcomitrium patens]|uniref:putative lysine-specific demethylase JMJ16 isoform X2 n=1 Tax=Physcomitrium patens TaxID=3218 RepID=UPI000D1537E0|nr:probable lysine-specific demethylase JMJ14 isoform X2 [Physcomitrium patens]|eukprot:XP_024398635.1 probable lysine-specific demethylase JMJ14 isoform X2 [Physcomitrella patens]
MALLPPLADSVRMSEEFSQKHILETVELNVSTDSQDESPLPPVRRKRIIRRNPTESSSEDEYVPKTVRRKSRISYCESDGSPDEEAGHVRLQQAVATKPELPYGVLRGCPSCRTCQKVLATWRPDAGRRPCIDEAPVFYPTEEEFKDPLRYIASIRARAEPYGVCRVVPPQLWRPPCPLRGDSVEAQNMEFPTRVQQVHKLQIRQPTTKVWSPTKLASKRRRGRATIGRMGGLAACTTSPPINDQPEYFGFWPGDPFPLRAFENYANDFKSQYFRIPERQSSEPDWEPTVNMIEGEYWRIVEQATEQIEVLYGADVETGKFGSGFPKAPLGSEAATHYEKSGWNLNNIARYPGSMLSFEDGDISGVLVPWLYIGMCFSSFCWHVEDHHFYSLNYMHWGAPKIWYGVPGSAADKLEAAMKKHLPDLFSEQPDLLHKLVTQLSPSFLKPEGVPVYRLVQQPGDFVITFPNAYHSGFNAGFNVAEAVNVAPVDWLPHGQAAVELYRELHRKTSVSHDKLLLGAARVAVRMCWHSQQNAGGLKPSLVSSWLAYCGEGGILAKALKARVDMERVHRESLKSSSGELLTLPAKQMDSSYDSTDERECETCKYDLHLSAVGCVCCPDKFTCLLHGHLLCSCPWSKKTMFYRYDLEQLSLLLAAVEGRPGAVANWVKQDALPPIPSPSLRDLLPSQVLAGYVPRDINLQMPHSSMSSAVVKTSTQINPVTFAVKKKMATQNVGGLHQVYNVLNSEPDNKARSFLKPPTLVRNSVQVASALNNNNLPEHNGSFIRSELKDGLGHSEGVFFPKPGHGRKNAPEHSGCSVSFQREFLNTKLGSTQQPARSSSEKLNVDASRPEVIMLSDEEEEMATCKLKEAVESTSPVHEASSVVSSRAAECDTGNNLGGRGCRAQPQVGSDIARCRSSTSNPLNSCGVSFPEGDPSHGSLEVARAGGSMKQLASVTAVRIPVKERPLHALSSASISVKPEAEVSNGHIAPPRSTTELVTVLQRNGSVCVPPRVARVRVKREVELLDIGRLVLREGWHTNLAIYSAGFKSRTRFIDVEDVLKTCIYVSEIIDRGSSARPLFQVIHPTKREIYLSETIDGCWRDIQDQINEAIIARRSDNVKLQLPPLLPPPSGLEMFGLTTTSIVEAMEALDSFHQCSDYWNGKQALVKQNFRPDLAEPEFRRAGISVGRLKEECLELPLRAMPDRAPQDRIVNINSRSSVNINNTKNTSGHAFEQGNPARQGVMSSGFRNERQDAYSTLQSLFQRATSAELRVLYRLFTTETQGTDWSSAFRALTEEVQKRFL